MQIFNANISNNALSFFEQNIQATTVFDELNTLIKQTCGIVDFFDKRSEQKSRYVTMGAIVGVPGHTYDGLYKMLPQNA